MERQARVWRLPAQNCPPRFHRPRAGSEPRAEQPQAWPAPPGRMRENQACPLALRLPASLAPHSHGRASGKCDWMRLIMSSRVPPKLPPPGHRLPGSVLPGGTRAPPDSGFRKSSGEGLHAGPRTPPWAPAAPRGNKEDIVRAQPRPEPGGGVGGLGGLPGSAAPTLRTLNSWASEQTLL